MNAIAKLEKNLSEQTHGTDIADKEWSLDSAYEFCARIARSHYENFPVGSFLIPRPLRKHFYSIYAFARTADDFADEGNSESITAQERLELIDRWRGMLRDAARGRASHPIFIALGATQKQFDLPLALFEDLLSAFSQDVTARRYETFDDLRDYCRRSANPIGRLILMLFGHAEEKLFRWSDDVCTALQLVNHWQDVAIDLEKDRLYIPLEDVKRFGLSVEIIKRGEATDSFRKLMEFELERAQEMFARGKPLCASVRGRLAFELRAIWTAGMRIVEKIRENDCDVFTRRPVITSADKASILLSAIGKNRFLKK
ncbi:MAG: squalene synthase HpnC [Acidobacteriota bacterium]